jgi:iron complex transport system permease protein
VASIPSSTSEAPGATEPVAVRRQRHSSVAPGAVLLPTVVLAGGSALLAVSLLLGVGIGAVDIHPADSIAIVLSHLGVETGAAVDPQQDAILWAIRLPRVLLGALVGGALAVSGAALQGIFRNPLADPSIIGVSSGAAFGAVVAIMFGLSGAIYGGLQISAFVAGVATAFVVYALARYEGRTETVTLVLTGIAITAIAAAGVGFLIARADDDQLRDIVFWSLGSLGGATWKLVGATLPFVALGAAVCVVRARRLDLLALGERDARYLGLDTERERVLVLGATALATAAAVAACGVVAFVGLVVPHLVRLAIGPAHRLLLPASFLLGASLLVLADLLARTATAPVELPLGVVTSLVGGPFFLWLIWRTRRAQGGWG